MDKKEMPKLKELTLGGYKSFSLDHPQTITFEDDVTILLGANGSGKSNLVSFFEMIGFAMTSRLQAYIAEKGYAHTLLYYGRKRTRWIDAKFLFQEGASSYNYNIQFTQSEPDTLVYAGEQAFESSKNGVYCHSELSEESIVKHRRESCPELITDILSSLKIYRFSDTSASGVLRQGSSLQSPRYLQTYGDNLAAFLYRIKHTEPRNYRLIVDAIRVVMPSFSDFYLEQEVGNRYVLLRWQDTSASDYVYGVHQLSDGTLRFMALAALLLQPSETIPNIILVDEPELGLHPAAINVLAEMIESASLKTQVIISTQSPDLVSCFEPHNLRVVETIMPKDLLPYTTVTKPAEEEIATWLEDYSLGEVWQKNIIGGRP